MLTTTKTTIETESSAYTCDRCGKPSGYSAPDLKSPRGGWVTEDARVRVRVRRSVEIERHTRRSMYDCGSVTEVEYDVCAECFDAVVRPAIEALGFKPRVVESDW